MESDVSVHAARSVSAAAKYFVFYNEQSVFEQF